jgi:vancomycin resistance protein YoaR
MPEARRKRSPARAPSGRRPPPRGRRRRNRGRARLLVLAAAVVAVLIGVGLAIGVRGDSGDVPAKVTVAGADVSGLSPAELEKAVRRRAAELMKVPLVITREDDPDFRVAATRASLGARPQIRRAVAAALEPRGVGGRIAARIGVTGDRDVPLRFTLDRRKVHALVQQVVKGVNDPARSASLTVTDDDIVATPAKSGYGIDPRELAERIEGLPEHIEVSLGPIAPAVGDAAAQAARRRALALVAHPVAVTLHGNGVPMDAATLRSALRFEPRSPELEVTLDPDTLYASIKDAYASREQPARDATFIPQGNTVRLVASRIGRRLDMPAIVREIVGHPGTRSVRARFTVSRPDRTTAQARALKITSLVSEFSTPYSCCEPRVTNIQRAAELLDGTIIPAGGRFSLNDALGQRTTERGFVPAPEIAAGRLKDAIGGGVSQVATTLYNAAFFAGLDLVAHTPHQFWISRYPPGREATVSWGGPELIFDNDWDAAILLDVEAGSGGITVRFYSSPLGRRVETETGEKTDVVQPSVKEIRDPSLPPGTREVEQAMGGAGFTITYTRTVYAGDTVKRDEHFSWKYDPEDEYVKVGPKKPATPATPGRRGSTTTAPGGATPPGSTTTGGTTTTAPPSAPPGTTTRRGPPAPPPG